MLYSIHTVDLKILKNLKILVQTKILKNLKILVQTKKKILEILKILVILQILVQILIFNPD